METRKINVRAKNQGDNDISFEAPALTLQEREDMLQAFAADRGGQRKKFNVV